MWTHMGSGATCAKGNPNMYALDDAGINPSAEASRFSTSIICRMAEVVSAQIF